MYYAFILLEHTTFLLELLFGFSMIRLILLIVDIRQSLCASINTESFILRIFHFLLCHGYGSYDDDEKGDSL